MRIKDMGTTHLLFRMNLLITEFNLKLSYMNIGASVPIGMLEYQFFEGPNKEINMRSFGLQFVIHSTNEDR
jgi:hypothetical protein